MFQPPKYDAITINHIYKSNNEIISKIIEKTPFSASEYEAVFRLPTNYLLCYLNGFIKAPEQLRKAKNYIKNLEDKTTYIKYKQAMRVIRKVKYH